MMGNISSLVNVKWFMGASLPNLTKSDPMTLDELTGIPFNDTSNWRLQIAEKGQQILGDNLAGLQVGNEPDLYAKHLRRPSVRRSAFHPRDLLNSYEW